MNNYTLRGGKSTVMRLASGTGHGEPGSEYECLAFQGTAKLWKFRSPGLESTFHPETGLWITWLILGYSVGRFKRAMKTPQSIVLTVPDCASSRATEIL